MAQITTSHILKHWSYLEKLSNEKKIEIVDYLSDGDTSLLKALHLIYNIPNVNRDANPLQNKWSWLRCKYEYVLVSQDTVHIGKKMRTRLLNEEIHFKIQEYLIKKDHLQFQ